MGQAIRACVEHPEWFDLRGKFFVLLGAPPWARRANDVIVLRILLLSILYYVHPQTVCIVLNSGFTHVQVERDAYRFVGYILCQSLCFASPVL